MADNKSAWNDLEKRISDLETEVRRMRIAVSAGLRDDDDDLERRCEPAAEKPAGGGDDSVSDTDDPCGYAGRFVLYRRTAGGEGDPAHQRFRFIRGQRKYVASQLSRVRSSSAELVVLLDYACDLNRQDKFAEAKRMLRNKRGVRFQHNDVFLPESMDETELVRLWKELDTTRAKK